MRNVLPTALIALSFCGFSAPSVMAQSVEEDTPEMPANCSVIDASKFIRAVVCTDASYGHEDFVTVGRVACGDVMPCGTWIWRDAANAPEKAPDNHDGLTEAQVTSAAGVWVAEKNSFIRIEEATN